MPERRRQTVVIAEDEYLIALDVQEAAREAGLEVVGVAADGAKAIELVRAHAPDAAILDIKMPVLDGLEVATRIREETAVILMTAYESAEFVAKARAAGAGAYLVKPPDPATLRRAVELAIARHGDLVELRRVNDPEDGGPP